MDKMDKRKKRTSHNQYLMYIKMMEQDDVFRTGSIPLNEDLDINYIQNKWKELAEELNSCADGVVLTAEEWKKRLNDWKNTTRCKHRRSLTDGDIQLTSLEKKGLSLFGATVPPTKKELHAAQLAQQSSEKQQTPASVPKLEKIEKLSVQPVKTIIRKIDPDTQTNSDYEALVLNCTDYQETLNQLEKDNNQHNVSDPLSASSADRRKKRTSFDQYVMYIKMVEEDEIFRTGNIPRDEDINYISRKWKELAQNLNTCRNGPSLTPDEWKKRLGDWRNSTRSKYRRSKSGEKNATLTPLEMKAIQLFDKTSPSSTKIGQTIIKLKREDETSQNYDEDEEDENDQQDEDEDNFEELLMESTDPAAAQSNVSAEVLPKLPTLREHSAVEDSPTKRPRIEEFTQIDGNQQISIPFAPFLNLSDANGITAQLKRLADAKEAKLQFEIAKFKFKNPGFEYSYPL